MNTPKKSFGSRTGQRGIVSVIAVIFLITAVIFVLTQTMSITGTTSIDNSQQRDSTAALFLAESGLEKAQAILAAAAKGVFTNNDCCIDGATGCNSPLSGANLDSGSFTYASATPIPATCGGSAPPCTACTVVVTGTVDNINRQVSRTFNLVPTPAYCNTANIDDCSNRAANSTTPPTWSLTLSKYNAPAYAGVGVFNLGTVPGSSSAILADCDTTGLGCLVTGDQQWKLSNGGSIFGLGSTVVQSTTDMSVYQRLSDPGKRNDVAMTGALFPGSASAAGSIIGAYSDGSSGTGTSTVGTTNLKGMTTNGAALGEWCDGGDTLVFGYSAHTSKAKTNGLQSGQLLFNTSGGSGVPLIPVTKTPTNVDTNASEKVYSEIWYKSNPSYGYGKWITGYTIPVPFYFVGDVNKAPNKSDAPYYPYATLVYDGPTTSAVLGVTDKITIKKVDCPSDPFNNLSNQTNEIIGFGDPVTKKCVSSPGDSRQVRSPLIICLMGDVANSGNSCKATITGVFNYTTLEVTSVNGISDPASPLITDLINSINHGAGTPANGDALVGPYVQTSTTLVDKLPTDPGALATYSLSRPTTSAANQNMVVGGATVTGSTVTLNGNANIPSPTNFPTDNTLLAIRINVGATTNGNLSANTVVKSTVSPTITLSKPALTNSVTNGAVICGGTCAFFDHTSAGKTEFQLASSNLPDGTDYWAAGFVCLKNVGEPSALLGGSGAKVIPGIWREVVK